MPAPGNSQPLVIGEKVITMADPNLLICVNVHTGKILWQTEIDHTSVMPPEQQAKARIEKKFIADLRQRYGSYVRRVRDLQAKVKALGVEVDAICVPCKNFKQLGEPEDAKLKEGFVKAMADSGVKAEFEALVKEQGTDFRFPFRWGGASGYGDYFVNIVKGDPVGERVMAAAREYDLYTFDSWGEMHTSLTFATPATDGQFIYVTTLNNAVAAVDLDGKVRWLVWDHLAERSKHTSGMFAGTGTGTRFVASPFLAQGKFVVNQNGEMRVYDCATGKKLWGVYDVVVKSGLSKRTGSQFPWRPEPEAASPSWTVLKLPGGGDLPVIYDSCYFLFRLEDGGIICTNLPSKGKGGSNVLVDDLVLWKSGNDGGAGPRGVKRLKAVSRDRVTVEDLWTMTDKQSIGAPGATDAYCGGRIYMGEFGFDALTGEVKKGPGRSVVGEGPSPIVAGNYQYCFGASGKGGVLGQECRPLDAGAPVGCKLVDRRWMDEDAWKEFAAFKRLEHDNTPTFQHNGSPSAQANRLFWRSQGYLWCIGDPKEPFPAPKNCPDAARVAR